MDMPANCDQFCQEMVEYLDTERQAAEAEAHAVPLGIFNGREYTYSQFDGQSVIMIRTLKKHPRDPESVDFLNG